MISNAAPDPAGRSMQIVVEALKPASHAVLAGQRGLDDLLLHLAVEREEQLTADVVAPQADQRVLLGKLGERGVQGAFARGVAGRHHGLQRGRGEPVPGAPRGRHAERVADLDVAQAPQLADLPGTDLLTPDRRAALEDADRGDLPLRVAAVPAGRQRGAVFAAGQRQPVPHVQRTGEHPHVRDLLPRRAALHLEHRAGDRARRVAVGGGQEPGEAGGQLRDPGPGDRRAEVHRVHQAPPGLGGQCPAQPPVGQPGLVAHVVGQQVLVVLGQQLGQPGGERGVLRAVAAERTSRGTQPGHRTHRHDRGSQPLGDARKHPPGVRARPVGLVHEDDRGNPQPPQCPHQHPGLRLDALDRGDDQHGAVQDAEHPLHLGDEIRVPGRVDQVDRDVADDERHHGGLDRDAALPLQGQRIGLGAARIDAADLVDDTGGVQQPLGQAGLAGINMGQNPQVQRSHKASCPYALA